MKKNHRELYRLFASVKNEKEAKMLLKDILTPAELDSILERWEIIKELNTGKTQRDIAEDLRLSISKVTRGSRALQYGQGGFKLFLKRLKK